MSVAQQTNKEKYKDYKSCTECFDKFGKSSGYDSSNSQPLFNKSNATNQGKRIVSVIGGIFVSAISLVIYSKANQAANAVH